MRILAIDNDPVVIELLVQMLLANTEHDVIAALTPHAALKAIDSPRMADFDCLLMDVDLAEHDGHALIRAVRERRAYQKIPIMVLTARSGTEHIEAAFAAGATDYMTKPFEVGALFARLSDLTTPAETPAGPAAAAAAPSFDTPVALSTPLRVFEAPNFIDLPALENYAKQLSRATLYGSCAYALAIRDVERLHKGLSPFDFHSTINDVADAIGAEMDTCKTLLSYVGDGVFMGIAEDNWRPQTERVMHNVNNRLAAAELMDEDGDAIDVKVSAGSAIKLGWKSGRAVLDGFTQAKQSADRARQDFGKLRKEFWFMDRSA